MENENKIKNIDEYLDDLDNLIDTGWFPKRSIEKYTFRHQNMNLDDFIKKGREYIRQYLMTRIYEK